MGLTNFEKCSMLAWRRVGGYKESYRGFRLTPSQEYGPICNLLSLLPML